MYNGGLVAKAASAFASTLSNSVIPDYDVLLGPAYKGIPLAAVTVLKLYEQFNIEKNYAYNRKEAKDVGDSITKTSNRFC